MAPKIPAVEVQDFDKPVTREEINAYAKRVSEFSACNKVELTATVRSLTSTDPKPKLDRETKQPRFDANGEQEFWPARHYAKLAFEGGEMEIETKPEWALQVGDKKKFIGSLGIVNRFGENVVGAVFRTVEDAPQL